MTRKPEKANSNEYQLTNAQKDAVKNAKGRKGIKNNLRKGVNNKNSEIQTESQVVSKIIDTEQDNTSIAIETEDRKSNESAVEEIPRLSADDLNTTVIAEILDDEKSNSAIAAKDAVIECPEIHDFGMVAVIQNDLNINDNLISSLNKCIQEENIQITSEQLQNNSSLNIEYNSGMITDTAQDNNLITDKNLEIQNEATSTLASQIKAYNDVSADNLKNESNDLLNSEVFQTNEIVNEALLNTALASTDLHYTLSKNVDSDNMWAKDAKRAKRSSKKEPKIKVANPSVKKERKKRVSKAAIKKEDTENKWAPSPLPRAAPSNDFIICFKVDNNFYKSEFIKNYNNLKPIIEGANAQYKEYLEKLASTDFRKILPDISENKVEKWTDEKLKILRKSAINSIPSIEQSEAIANPSDENNTSNNVSNDNLFDNQNNSSVAVMEIENNTENKTIAEITSLESDLYLSSSPVIKKRVSDRKPFSKKPHKEAKVKKYQNFENSVSSSGSPNTKRSKIGSEIKNPQYVIDFSFVDEDKKGKPGRRKNRPNTVNYESLLVKNSAIHGQGIFTQEKIPENSLIMKYEGEIIGKCVSDKRERIYLDNGINSIYMFKIAEDMIIDATLTGNKARYINHSCNPNCYTVSDMSNKSILYISTRDIEENEELTIDYHFSEDNPDEVCNCGDKNCKSINN